MCVKKCMCNKCYKRKTCIDCEYFKNDDTVDCNNNGVIYYDYQVKYGISSIRGWNKLKYLVSFIVLSVGYGIGYHFNLDSNSLFYGYMLGMICDTILELK